MKDLSVSDARGVALVTGASRGIGRACARHLAMAGFDLVLCARTVREGMAIEHSATLARSDTSPLPGSLETVAREVEALGRRALAVKMDLNEKPDLANAVAETLETFGRIDVLVNNGRYMGPGYVDPFLALPVELFERHLACNVTAPFYLTQLVTRPMARQGGGRIINLTSWVAWAEPGAPPGQGGTGIAYPVSKAALHRLAPGLAKELRPLNIAILNLDPGRVTTERFAADMAAHGFRTEGRLSMDVPAAACVYLATCDSPLDYTGQTVNAEQLVREQGLLM
jgi:NAD(P)-dependent dehydrogenase (short-subunit alcohol dehydrogenase family)